MKNFPEKTITTLVFRSQLQDDTKWDGEDCIMVGGKNILKNVVSALRVKGISTSDVIAQDYYAWCVRIHGKNISIWAMLSPTDEDLFRLTFDEERKNFLDVLFGRHHLDEFASIVSSVSAVLMQFPEITDLLEKSIGEEKFEAEISDLEAKKKLKEAKQNWRKNRGNEVVYLSGGRTLKQVRTDIRRKTNQA